MGRSKLEMRYREDSKARLTTYLNRVKGAQKKARELSILCGVDILFLSFSPDLSAIHFWPEDPPEFRRIVERYRRHRRQSVKPSGACFPSPALPSVQEELSAMDRKLEEARGRIRFLEASSENLDHHADQASPPFF